MKADLNDMIMDNNDVVLGYHAVDALYTGSYNVAFGPPPEMFMTDDELRFFNCPDRHQSKWACRRCLDVNKCKKQISGDKRR